MLLSHTITANKFRLHIILIEKQKHTASHKVKNNFPFTHGYSAALVMQSLSV